MLSAKAEAFKIDSLLGKRQRRPTVTLDLSSNDISSAATKNFEKNLDEPRCKISKIDLNSSVNWDENQLDWYNSLTYDSKYIKIPNKSEKKIKISTCYFQNLLGNNKPNPYFIRQLMPSPCTECYLSISSECTRKFEDISCQTSQTDFEITNGDIFTREGITIQLVNYSLWAQFHKYQTEMIITRNGRRIFPVIKIRIFGLDPESLYIIYLDLKDEDQKKYRYSYASSCWMVCGSGEPLVKNQEYIHSDSPLKGKEWMEMGVILFDKMKLTNNKKAISKDMFFLYSMQKYVPRIWIQKVQNFEESKVTSANTLLPEMSINLKTLIKRQDGISFVFPETSFMTVTAYQNQQVTNLKISSNPFAKGFRKNSNTKIEFRNRGQILDFKNSLSLFPYENMEPITTPIYSNYRGNHVGNGNNFLK